MNRRALSSGLLVVSALLPAASLAQAANSTMSYSALASALNPALRQIITPVTARVPRAAVIAELGSSDTSPLGASEEGQALQKVLLDPAVQDIQVVHIDVDALKVPLDPTADAQRGQFAGLEVISEKRLKSADDMSESWWAKLKSADGTQRGDALIVWRGDRASGLIRTDSEVITIRPLADSLFALTSVSAEFSDRQADDVAVPESGPDEGATAADAPQDCANPPAPSTLDLLVYFTPAAMSNAFAVGHDVEHLIEIGASLMNASFINSNINAAVRVAGLQPQPVTAETDYAAVLQRMRSGISEFAGMGATRKTVKADIVVVVVHNDDKTNCGKAATIGASSASAFAVVNWQCLTDKYSFAHEIGHLAGAWHDPATLGGLTANPAYAQGFVSLDPLKKFATVMAYRTACAPCGRVWHWSDPNIKYHSIATGTASSNYDACVWRLALPRLREFGDSLP